MHGYKQKVQTRGYQSRMHNYLGWLKTGGSPTEIWRCIGVVKDKIIFMKLCKLLKDTVKIPSHGIFVKQWSITHTHTGIFFKTHQNCYPVQGIYIWGCKFTEKVSLP